MITRYWTRSGSIYEVDTINRLVRKLVSGAGQEGRLASGGPWRQYVEITAEVGRRMVIHWGAGRDDFSPDDGIPDEHRRRSTETTEVTKSEQLTSP